jgi:hypothetical protein
MLANDIKTILLASDDLSGFQKRRFKADIDIVKISPTPLDQKVLMTTTDTMKRSWYGHLKTMRATAHVHRTSSWELIIAGQAP